MKRTQMGSSIPQLLLLLVLLVGGAAFNYHRNLEAEAQEDRPYRGYSDQQLEDMLQAYEGRKEQQSARYESTAGRRADARGKAYFDEQVQEFERVQKVHAARDRARDQLAGTQVVVKKIRAEQTKRASEADKLMLHLRRAFSVN